MNFFLPDFSPYDLVKHFVKSISLISWKVNPSHVTVLFLHTLKSSENQRFYDALGGIERDQWYEIG